MLVSMVTLSDVYKNVLGAIFLAFSKKLAKLAEGAVLRVVMSWACRVAKFFILDPKLVLSQIFFLLPQQSELP